MIIQLLPSVHSGDAVGDSAFEISKALSEIGIENHILGIHIDDPLRDKVIDFKEFKTYDTPDTVHIYHFAVPSPITYVFQEAQGKKILIYHNITPPHFFEGYYPELVQMTVTGRHEIKLLADCTDLALGDSEFNRRELEAYGFKKTGVLPLLIDFDKYKVPPDSTILKKFGSKTVGTEKTINLLFVGRVSPNKKHEDLIKTFYFYQKYIYPSSRLLLVGKYKGMEKYLQFLQGLVKKLQLSEVHFVGHVSLEELIAFYKVSHVFLCLSEHEGFCVPLLESMVFDLPILAYRSTAVPFTLGSSGVLINEKRYEEIAEMIHLLITDPALREAIIQAQRKRLMFFSRERVKGILLNYLKTVI
ncbi:MAG TPA: glycosyltransferase [Candidatus Limnocylindrales bacterium]|nr:glycosyltransferase [Candidatus Limnocylindrales bacterium]